MLHFLFLLAMIGFIYYLVSLLWKIWASVKGASSPLGANERCPSCHTAIRVTGEEMICPRCGARLGRTSDGKLAIRVN